MKSHYKKDKQTSLILEEPAASYATGSYYNLSAQSISKTYIKKVLKLTGLSVTELISLLPISIDTYKRKSIFNPSVTEKILEIEEVYRRGIDAFGKSFHQWMLTENIAIGGGKPKALLSNSFGIRLLLDEIGRLEHGVLA
ncbi:MAG: antitoxin Xre/MbcA/ParS toxin-binding domain-containing protein [Bacteroidota bacterium]